MPLDPNVEMLVATLRRRRNERAGAETSENDYFNTFVADLLLKNYQPSDREVAEGIVDGSLDCGLDAVYVFINDVLLAPGFRYEFVGNEPRIKLILLQAKLTGGFGEDAVLKLASYLPKLLDLRRVEKALDGWCNPRLRAASKKFLDAYR